MFDYLLQTTDILGMPVLVALAAAVSITALSYMAGEFFSMPSLKAFSKVELSELFVTMIIILIVLALGVGGAYDIIAQGFMLQGVTTTPDRVCPEWAAMHGPYLGGGKWANGSMAYAQADFFLGCRPRLSVPGAGSPFGIDVDGVILRKLTLGYSSLMITEMFIGALSGLSTNIAVPVLYPLIKIDVGLMPWISMGPLNDTHTLLVDLMGASWAAFAAQKMLLIFIEEAALSVFLPFGLLLRAFPFSRKTGSTIVAVVFVAYFIYPISILINQQIWEMIANPQPQPGGPNCIPTYDQAGNEQLCMTDDQCCSLDCRYRPDPSTGAPRRVCASPVTDFSEYESVFSICYGKDIQDVNRLLHTQADEHDKQLMDVFFGGSASSGKWTQTAQKMKDGQDELVRKGGIISAAVTNMWFPTPKQTSIAVFREVEVLVMDASQFVLMAILFVVIEIVITMTLLKDFALLIGGEPRVFGITKLV